MTSKTIKTACQAIPVRPVTTIAVMISAMLIRTRSQPITTRCRECRSRIGLTKGPTTENGSMIKAITAATAQALGCD